MLNQEKPTVPWYILNNPGKVYFSHSLFSWPWPGTFIALQPKLQNILLNSLFCFPTLILQPSPKKATNENENPVVVSQEYFPIISINFILMFA